MFLSFVDKCCSCVSFSCCQMWLLKLALFLKAALVSFLSKFALETLVSLSLVTKDLSR